MFGNWLKTRGGGERLILPQKVRQSYLKRKKIGAILIEFAFAIPIFLVLIYYIHDLPKMKLMQRKSQFAINVMAATIQNVSKQCIAEGRSFNLIDIRNAFRLSLLSIYPGMTQYSAGNGWSYMPLGILPTVHMYCYTGTGNNIAQLKNHYRMHAGVGVDLSMFVNLDTWHDTIIMDNQTNAQEIYKDFTIQPDEHKVILDLGMHNQPSMTFGVSGIRTDTVPLRSLFGLLFYTPVSPARRKTTYFHAVTIFTPIWNFDNTLQ